MIRISKPQIETTQRRKSRDPFPGVNFISDHPQLSVFHGVIVVLSLPFIMIINKLYKALEVNRMNLII